MSIIRRTVAIGTLTLGLNAAGLGATHAQSVESQIDPQIQRLVVTYCNSGNIGALEHAMAKRAYKKHILPIIRQCENEAIPSPLCSAVYDCRRKMGLQ